MPGFLDTYFRLWVRQCASLNHSPLLIYVQSSHLNLFLRSALPLAIVGAHKFYAALTNFLSLIGYWASAYGGILLVEHLYFRRGDFSTYHHADWNVARRLPWGAAALAASMLSFALVIPCMNQVWFVGPIGLKTGDIGFEVAFPLASLLYFPFRTLERRYQNIH